MVVSGGAIIADRLECWNVNTNCPIKGIADVVPLSLGFSICVGDPKTVQIQTVDLVYVIDATKSMGPWIQQVKNDIKELIDSLTDEFPSSSFRIAGVAYRDWQWSERDPVHLQHIDFTHDIGKFKNWLSKLEDVGGQKTAEDVLGGLNRANKLTWNEKSAVKLVILVGDAPPHNKMYHQNEVTDEYPDGHPTDPVNYHQVVLDEFNKRGVNLMIAKLTDNMNI
eukprot:248622_1